MNDSKAAPTAGGYVLSGRGPWWSRIMLGVLAIAPVPARALAPPAFGPPCALNFRNLCPL